MTEDYIQSLINAAFAAGESADLGPDRPGPIVQTHGGTIATEYGRLVYYPPGLVDDEGSCDE